MFKDFNSLKIGSTAELQHKITIEDVKRFVEMTGDNNPLHVDREYAEQTSFRDVVVHGMLGASFISTVIGTKLPGPGALWISQSLDFLLPVRLNDELCIISKVTEKYDRDNIIDLETKITNQYGQTVLKGIGKVKLLEQPKALLETSSEIPRSKTALVTGGSGGIGKSICLALSSVGYDVVVNYHTDDERANHIVSEIVSSGGKAVAIKADVSFNEDINNLIKRIKTEFGPISVLVNNASGRIGAKPFLETDWCDITAHLNTQLKAAFLLSQACIPDMQKMKFGRIINITSQVTEGTPPPTWTSYSIGKSSLATFSRCLAVEFGHYGIRVNCVAPGMTETRLIGDLPERLRLTLARQNPTRRLAKPEDIASAVVFLASENADFINGETLRVNGGSSMI